MPISPDGRASGDNQTCQLELFPTTFCVVPVTASPTFGESSAVDVSKTPLPHLDCGFVEAVAIDYAETAIATIRAASIAGSSHRLGQSVRQDSFALAEPVEGLVVAPIGDGLGSFDISHIAAMWACQAACKLLAEALVINPALNALSPEAVLSPINESLLALRQALGLPLATTLLVCVVAVSGGDSSQAWLARVGDSTAVKLSQAGSETPRWQFLFGGQERVTEGIETNKTNALPARNIIYEQTLMQLPAGTALFLLTDGVSFPLTMSPSMREGLGRLWLTPPAPFDFASHVSFDRRGEYDDRTVVGIWPRR
jgi:hypothetical protein